MNGNLLQASIEGLAIVDRARQRCGWTKTSTARWWQTAHTSKATLRRFWQQERIQREIFMAICAAVGVSDWTAIAVSNDLDRSDPIPRGLIDLDEAPDLGSFYGRDRLQSLAQWIVHDHCKLITVLGLAGIGKTSLVLALADQLAGTDLDPPFAAMIWRSLRSAPSLLLLLESLLHQLAPAQADFVTVDQGCDRLLQYLRQHRCLLILDGFDTLLAPRQVAASRYAPGYESYGDFLQRVCDDRHQSCVVLTSREQPQDIASAPIFKLTGLTESAALTLLSQQGFTGQERGLKALIRLYGGNPLALKAIAPIIQTVFGGNVAGYLNQNTLVVGDRLRHALQQQLTKLSPLEQAIVDWLAIWQVPIALSRLQTHLLNPPLAAMVESIADLEGRSLLEKYFGSRHQDDLLLSLPPLVLQVVSDRLVERAAQELTQVRQTRDLQCLQLWRTHCLLRPGTDDIAGDRLLTQLAASIWRSGSVAALDILAISTQLNALSPFAVGYANYNLMALAQRLDIAIAP